MYTTGVNTPTHQPYLILAKKLEAIISSYLHSFANVEAVGDISERKAQGTHQLLWREIHSAMLSRLFSSSSLGKCIG